MSIGDLARQSGIAASAIRYYEAIGLLPPPARVGGRRVYDDGAMARLTAIRFAKEAGFTLAEVRQLVRGFAGERWTALATKKLAEIDATAARLEVARRMLRGVVACGCFDLEECGRRILAARAAPRRSGRSHRRSR
ncbi:MAG: MerR family transcriptional regulator [Acidobacteriota bacterium]